MIELCVQVMTSACHCQMKSLTALMSPQVCTISDGLLSPNPCVRMHALKGLPYGCVSPFVLLLVVLEIHPCFIFSRSAASLTQAQHIIHPYRQASANCIQFCGAAHGVAAGSVFAVGFSDAIIDVYVIQGSEYVRKRVRCHHVLRAFLKCVRTHT